MKLNRTGPLLDGDMSIELLDGLLDISTTRPLGEGLQRRVYAFNELIDDTLVLKLARDCGLHQNIHEYQLWVEARDIPAGKWLAPCLEISANGRWLLQKRTQPARLSDLPTRVPVFFTDLKVSNWGLLEGVPVCHDYGMTLALTRGLACRLRKAHWYDDTVHGASA